MASSGKGRFLGALPYGMTENIHTGMAVAFITRLLFAAYGFWQDKTMVVKYTDVDYDVFTDAARHITQGGSPYDRLTYRYTPLLAFLLTPNIYVTPHFGKLLFIIFDVWAGYLIYAILLQGNLSPRKAGMYACLWLLNPIPMVVSSRGNAESIMAVLVLATIYCIQHRSRLMVFLSFVLYAVSVHVKLYPVTFALPLYLMLNDTYSKRSTPWWKLLGMDVLPNKTRMAFIVTSLLTFGLLTGACYHMYGNKFLQETYLYHVTRRDTRHNFSVYFYMLYLLAESEWSQLVGLVAFLPQLILLVASSIKFFDKLALCCFIHTFVFVTFNKVCTSQYFLWYLCLLPLIAPDLKISGRKALLLVALWLVGQALWLRPAFYLEFEGRNTFLLLWMAGIMFFFINIYIMYVIITSHTRSRPPRRKESHVEPSPLARKPIRSNNKKYE